MLNPVGGIIGRILDANRAPVHGSCGGVVSFHVGIRKLILARGMLFSSELIVDTDSAALIWTVDVAIALVELLEILM